jgi:hypothetical protein
MSRCSAAQQSTVFVAKTTVATTTVTTTVATTTRRQPSQQQNSHVAAATLLDSYVRQFCSTVLLDSSTLASFCYCAYIASAIALVSCATINQICLDDKLSYGQPMAFVSTTAIRQANMAKPNCFYNATKRRQATTDSLFQATNGPADRPM